MPRRFDGDGPGGTHNNGTERRNSGSLIRRRDSRAKRSRDQNEREIRRKERKLMITFVQLLLINETILAAVLLQKPSGGNHKMVTRLLKSK